jgi:hypothetical protein
VRGRQLFREVKARGCTGSFSNLERLLVKWRCPTRHPAVVAVRTTDPATGRLISRIVAAALCVKPRGLPSDNQAAKIDALKSCWPDFAAMRQLAMRFRGLLRSKHVANLGVWLKDAHQSGLYATAMRPMGHSLAESLVASCIRPTRIARAPLAQGRSPPA